MAVQAARVSVTTTATPLSGAPTDRSAGSAILVRPKGGAIVLGGSDVTTANGFEVADGEAVEFELDRGEIVYGITATGAVTAHVLRQGV